MLPKFDYASFRIRQISRAPWFLPSAFSAVAIVTVLIAFYIARFVPDKLPFTIDHGALESILTILGSSMLTIAVFALSTLVNAVSQASQATTPRAVPLIVEDRTAQAPISVFIGAFLYSIVGIIGLSSGIYSDAGRLVLFFVTIAVVVIVVAALIRWVGHTSQIGRTSETIELVEHAAAKAMRALAEAPRYGCRARRGPVPEGRVVTASDGGYLLHFDLSRLNELVEGRELTIHLLAGPGAVIRKNMALAVLVGAAEDDDSKIVHDAFSIGPDRTFEYDPRYGIAVLSEIAARALSAAANDAGTAKDVISALIRILAESPGALAAADDGPRYPQLTLPQPSAEDYLATAFRDVARDGAGQRDVLLRLVEGISWLAQFEPYRDAAISMLAEIDGRAQLAMPYAPDRDAVTERIAELSEHYSASPPSEPSLFASPAASR